jgi:tetratricopeptide (TPR) repeat protein
MSRPLLALCFVLALSTTLLGKDEGKQGAVFVKASGNTIEGKVIEKDGRVYVAKGTITYEFGKDEVTINYAAPSAESGPKDAGKGWVQITRKRDGSTVRGELVDQNDESITIRPKGQSTVTFKKNDVEVAEISDPSAAEADLGERYMDYEGRFQIEKPSPEWKIRKSTSPETRALMTLNGQDAFVTVSVKPAPGAVNAAYSNPSKESARQIQSEVEADLRSEISKPSSVQGDAAELHGCPVLEYRYEGSFPSETTVYQFIEQRFARDGLIYAIRAAAEKKNAFKTVEPKLREAFASFSFIATQGGDDEGYNDLLKGFGIVRPTAKWTVDARPFDEKEPVVIIENAKRGEIHLYVVDANSRTEATFVDEYLKGSPTRSDFKVVDKKESRRNGQTVMTYHCTYFEGKAQNKSDEQGLVALADNKILHVVGIAPYADADAKDVQGEVQKVLEGFKVFDPKRTRLGNGALAVQNYTTGVDQAGKKQWADAIKSFDEAIRLYPDYARAFYARAEAHVQQKEWKDYQNDLQRVIELDPRPETAQRAASLYKVEADTRTKDKQWTEAYRAWKEVVRNDSKESKSRGDFLKFYETWWNEEKKVPSGKKPDEVIAHWEEAISTMEAHAWADKEFEPKMAAMLTEAGTAILQADKKAYQKARSLASRALGLDKSCKAATDLKKQCDEAQKQLESTPKKGK